MEILKNLKFVSGAVAKATAKPTGALPTGANVGLPMTHFRIQDGIVRGYNGVIALSAPLPLDLDCKPDAAKLIAAVDQCKSNIDMKMTPAGKLSIKSGGFKVFVPCLNEAVPFDVVAAGEKKPVDGKALVDAFKQLLPFVGTDANVQWSQGVLLKGKSAFATNNATAAQVYLGVEFGQTVNVPVNAIKELMRIGEAPIAISFTHNTMSFYFEGDRWLCTRLYSVKWPDIEGLFPPMDKCNLVPIGEDFWDVIDSAKKFVDSSYRIIFADGMVRTHRVDDEGAQIKLNGVPNSVFNINALLLLRPIAKKIDFSRYPAACVFTGGKVRGLIMGLRE